LGSVTSVAALAAVARVGLEIDAGVLTSVSAGAGAFRVSAALSNGASIAALAAVQAVDREVRAEAIALVVAGLTSTLGVSAACPCLASVAAIPAVARVRRRVDAVAAAHEVVRAAHGCARRGGRVVLALGATRRYSDRQRERNKPGMCEAALHLAWVKKLGKKGAGVDGLGAG
jgi:hypothetical protein